MTIDQLTDIAYEIASELEPGRDIDVFEVDGSHITFKTEHGLRRISATCGNGSLKEEIKKKLDEKFHSQNSFERKFKRHYNSP